MPNSEIRLYKNRTQHCSRLLLHIHGHTIKATTQHNTSGSLCCVTKPSCNTKGPFIPGYIPRARALLFRRTKCQKTVARSGCHRQVPAISAAGREELLAKLGRGGGKGWSAYNGPRKPLVLFYIYSKEASGEMRERWLRGDEFRKVVGRREEQPLFSGCDSVWATGTRC